MNHTGDQKQQTKGQKNQNSETDLLVKISRLQDSFIKKSRLWDTDNRWKNETARPMKIG